jgi:hypothetical protein
MNDMSPIAEPTDLEIAKAKVAELEAKLAAAWKGHYEKFPGGRCSVEQRAALQAVQAIEYDLKEARQVSISSRSPPRASVLCKPAMPAPIARKPDFSRFAVLMAAFCATAPIRRASSAPN